VVRPSLGTMDLYRFGDLGWKFQAILGQYRRGHGCVYKDEDLTLGSYALEVPPRRTRGFTASATGRSPATMDHGIGPAGRP
jgi:hypothetical protein